jgi:hypothetical protein
MLECARGGQIYMSAVFGSVKHQIAWIPVRQDYRVHELLLGQGYVDRTLIMASG